jgi:hypothetical protein
MLMPPSVDTPQIFPGPIPKKQVTFFFNLQEETFASCSSAFQATWTIKFFMNMKGATSATIRFQVSGVRDLITFIFAKA